MEIRVHSSIESIGEQDWDAAAGSAYPFLRYAFLQAAEETGCAARETGWQPAHLSLNDGDTVLGVMPLYAKSHSWGEFVFDWAWANAYARAGVQYYPKLISAIPFTPAPCPKLLLKDGVPAEHKMLLARGALEFAQQSKFSSLHVLFPLEEELALFAECGLTTRKDCQFHWHNQGYSSFDDFLQNLNSRKRKKAKRDRRHVLEHGIRFRHVFGQDLSTDDWEQVHRLISLTFMRRGSTHYFNLEFFLRISRELPNQVLVVIAEDNARAVAAAVFLVGEKTLYGRYWGSSGDYNALHFETCYFQGIDFCIANGIEVFEPGTQGEHKISRGFIPAATWSSHWLAHPQFYDAIRDYLELEVDDVERYMQAVDDHSPYRKQEQ